MERIISYDLKHANQTNYQDLYEVLDKLNTKQLTESSYVIDTPLNQKQIIKMIKKLHITTIQFIIFRLMEKAANYFI